MSSGRRYPRRSSVCRCDRPAVGTFPSLWLKIVSYELQSSIIEIRQTEVYRHWFNRLRDDRAKARITARLYRLSLGNPGDVRPVGAGVSELRIDYGPGYRV